MAVLSQIIGAALVVAGCLMIYVPFGLVVGGVLFVVYGVLLEAARETKGTIDGPAAPGA